MDKNPRRQEAGRLGGLKSRGGGFAYMKRTNPERLKEVIRLRDIARSARRKEGQQPDTSGKHD